MKNTRIYLCYKCTSEKDYKKIKTIYKNDKKIIQFDDIETEKYKFHQYLSPISINDIDINEIEEFNNFPLAKQNSKYFIGYKDNKEIRPLCIFSPEMSINKRYSGETKCMCFIIKNEKDFDK